MLFEFNYQIKIRCRSTSMTSARRRLPSKLPTKISSFTVISVCSPIKITSRFWHTRCCVFFFQRQTRRTQRPKWIRFTRVRLIDCRKRIESSANGTRICFDRFRRRVTIPKGVNPEQVTCTLAPGGVLQICAPKQTTEGISAHVFIPNRLFPIESILKMICFVVYRLQRVGSSDCHSTRRSIGRSLRRSQSRAQQVKKLRNLSKK